MIPVFTGTIKNRDFNATTNRNHPFLDLDMPSRWDDYLCSLMNVRVDIIVRKHKAQRSNNQNNYYFGVVCKILGDYFGYTEEEMHDALKMKFLRHGAADLETVKSTTKLNTTEFEEYLEKIRRWAITEYSLYVPLPNEAEVD